MSRKEIPMFPPEGPAISVVDKEYASYEGDLLLVGGFKGGENAWEAVEVSLQGRLGSISDGIFDNVDEKPGTAVVSRVAVQGLNAIAGVALGSADKAKASVPWGKTPFQTLGEAGAVAASSLPVFRLGVTLLDASSLPEDVQVTAIEKIALGIRLGGYSSSRFKGKTPKLGPSLLQNIEILGFAKVPEEKAAAALERAAAIAKGVLLARYLVETPANICKPAYLAEAAAKIAESAPDVLKLEVLEREDCEKLGMGLYLGVAECAESPPKFIHLTYTPPGGDSGKVIGLVGKGLTFDSGGYNLKVGSGIEMMKFDMGGAAAVLGAAQVLAALKPKGVTIHIISASCENMIDGKGLRPGDVLTAASGKTVEVDNTDAEGRLTLADALWYAQEKCGVQSVVNVATLTGACMVALGKDIAGLFTPSDAIAQQLQHASQAAGEKLWRMPMEESYLQHLESPIADLKNTGIQHRYGGAINASLFLKEFVNTDKVEWAHLDIAGPAWNEKAGGATGYGAQTLAEWASAQGQ